MRYVCRVSLSHVLNKSINNINVACLFLWLSRGVWRRFRSGEEVVVLQMSSIDRGRYGCVRSTEVSDDVLGGQSEEEATRVENSVS